MAVTRETTHYRSPQYAADTSEPALNTAGEMLDSHEVDFMDFSGYSVDSSPLLTQESVGLSNLEGPPLQDDGKALVGDYGQDENDYQHHHYPPRYPQPPEDTVMSSISNMDQYEDMLRSEHDAAIQESRKLQGPDDFPTSPNQQYRLARRVRDAIVSVDDVYDELTPGGKDPNAVTRFQRGVYSEAYLERRSWKVVVREPRSLLLVSLLMCSIENGSTLQHRNRCCRTNHQS